MYEIFGAEYCYRSLAKNSGSAMANSPMSFFGATASDFVANAKHIYQPLLEAESPMSLPIGLVLAKYDDVNFVLRSRDFGRTYWFGLSSIHGDYVRDEYSFQVLADWLVELNPPAHTRLRKLMQRPFGSANIDALTVQIEHITDALIHKIRAKDEFDLVKDFAFPLPVLVICRMLGIPSDDYGKFLHEPMVPASILDPLPIDRKTMDESNERFYALRDYFLPLFLERRKNPRDDLISMLVHEHVEGDQLSESELLSNVILLFFAGHETTASLISAGMRELFSNPAQLHMLRNDYSLIENAVYEMLRLVSVAQLTIYTAFKDVEINGALLKESTAAFCWLAAANRDPRVFSNPDQMDITRANAKKHLSFGGGIHYCLGAHLAKVEAMIAIERILKAFPNLELLDLDKPKWRNTMALRALDVQMARTNLT